jgi:hypothetical protein
MTETEVPASAEKMTAFRVVTRASTISEFVEAFWRFTDESSIFLPVASPLPVGRRQLFRVTLADGSLLMCGEGEVIEAVRDRQGAFACNGMRLRFLRTSKETRRMHQDLLRRRPAVQPPRLLTAGTGLAVGTDIGFAGPGPAPAAFGSSADLDGPTCPSLPFDPPPPPAEVEPPADSLPANPFATISTEALQHFVDCTMFEDTSLEPDEATTWAPLVPMTSIFRAESSAGAPAASVLQPPPLPAAAMTAAEPPPGVDSTALIFAPPAMGRAERELPVAALRPRAGLTAILGGLSLTGVAIGVLAGWLMWGRYLTQAQMAAPAASVAAPAAIVPVAAAAAAAVPAAAADADAAPVAAAVPAAAPVAAAAEPPAAAPAAPAAPAVAETCTLTIATTPPGAKVQVDDLELGVTPLEDVEVACAGTLTLDHPRYARVVKALQLEPGAASEVTERLVRPPGSLVIQSTPSGALVTVNGRPSGKTPLTVKVAAFEQAEVAISMAGFKPWSQRAYPNARPTTVTAALVEIPRAKKSKGR